MSEVRLFLQFSANRECHKYLTSYIFIAVESGLTLRRLFSAHCMAPAEGGRQAGPEPPVPPTAGASVIRAPWVASAFLHL